MMIVVALDVVEEFGMGIDEVGKFTSLEDLRLIVSQHLKTAKSNTELTRAFLQKEGTPLTLPEKNLPEKTCLAWHREKLR